MRLFYFNASNNSLNLFKDLEEIVWVIKTETFKSYRIKINFNLISGNKCFEYYNYKYPNDFFSVLYLFCLFSGVTAESTTSYIIKAYIKE